MKKLYRQGDVYLIPINAMSPNCNKVSRVNGRIILAEGEVTGHSHSILDKEATLYESDMEEMRQRFLLVEKEVDLIHEEHGTITLDPSVYEVRIQREYSPEEIRQVID